MPGMGRATAAALGFWGLFVIAGALVITGLAWAAAPASAKPGPVFTVGRVSVNATADDAVQAKDKAIAQGQERALRLLLKRLTPFSSHNRFPYVDPKQAERMMDGMSVRAERNSSTQYLATLDFSFQANAVKEMLNRSNLVYTADRSPEVSVLPVLVEKGAVKPAGRNPWQKAFDGLDLDHMLTPMKVVPPRPEFVAATLGGASTGAGSVIETLKLQYHTQHLLLAYAEVDAAANVLNIRLVGTDPAGEINLSRRYKIYDRDLDEVSTRAADIAAKTVEDRWKLTKLAPQGAQDAPSELERIDITAEFAGARDWGQMRAKLQQAPGIQGFEVKSLYARGASISLDYPGGAERLAKVLQSKGIILENRDGEWTLSMGAQ